MMIIKPTFLKLYLTLLIFGVFNSTFAKEQALDSIAAIVNSDVIMVSELRTNAQQAQSKQTESTNQKQLFKDVLEKMIMDKIQVQKAKAIGIKIDDAAVDTAMQSIAKQNQLDLQQLRLAIIQRGMNYKDFRESIRDRLYSDNLRKRQQGRNKIIENEVDDLIKAESYSVNKNIKYQLIDFVISNKINSVNQFNTNLNRARKLRAKLLNNDKLTDIEIKKMGATKKPLGWLNAETLSTVYSRTLSLLGEGEYSDVFRDSKGFHILKLVGKQGGQKQEITEAKVRHILIKNEEPQAKLKVTQLRNKILAGESFQKLANQFSDDKGSATAGGELPMTNSSNYVPPFAAVVNTLALKTLSQPVKTKFGWHIIEVLERRITDNTRETIKKQAKQLVSKQKLDDNLRNWLKGLRDEAFVEYRIKF